MKGMGGRGGRSIPSYFMLRNLNVSADIMGRWAQPDFMLSIVTNIHGPEAIKAITGTSYILYEIITLIYVP